jgi:hypothetical protein
MAAALPRDLFEVLYGRRCSLFAAHQQQLGLRIHLGDGTGETSRV